MTSAKCTLKTVHKFAAERTAFNCNATLKGEWTEDRVKFGWIKNDRTSVDLANHLMGSCKNFVVYSYDTPIAVFNHKGWWKNPDKYTVTTSRHMGSIRI